VDLGSSYNINRVKIVWEAAYATAYQVQVSADGASWSSIKTVTGNTTLTNDWTGLSGTGRYIRIHGTARGTVWGYSIYELEVYGTSGCSVPAQPGAISGNTSVAFGSNQTYSVAAVSRRFIGRPLTPVQEFLLLLAIGPFLAALALWALTDSCRRDGGDFDVTRLVCEVAE
jgi:hypothetical protein